MYDPQKFKVKIISKKMGLKLRRWSDRTWKSLPFMKTSKIHLQMKQFSPKTNQSLAERLQYTKALRQIHSELSRKERDTIRLESVSVGWDSEEKGHNVGGEHPWGVSNNRHPSSGFWQREDAPLAGWRASGTNRWLWEAWILLVHNEHMFACSQSREESVDLNYVGGWLAFYNHPSMSQVNVPALLAPCWSENSYKWGKTLAVKCWGKWNPKQYLSKEGMAITGNCTSSTLKADHHSPCPNFCQIHTSAPLAPALLSSGARVLIWREERKEQYLKGIEFTLFEEFSRLRNNIVFMRMQVWSLAFLGGLRIQCSHKLQHRSQRQLGPSFGVAVALAYSSDSTPTWELPYVTGVAIKIKNK